MRQAILSLLATLTGSATAGLWGNCSNSSSGNSNWLVFDPKCAGKGSFCVGNKLVSTSFTEAQCQTACEGNSSCTAFANDYRGGNTGICFLCGGDCTSPCKCSYYGTASPVVAKLRKHVCGCQCSVSSENHSPLRPLLSFFQQQRLTHTILNTQPARP